MCGEPGDKALLWEMPVWYHAPQDLGEGIVLCNVACLFVFFGRVLWERLLLIKGINALISGLEASLGALAGLGRKWIVIPLIEAWRN